MDIWKKSWIVMATAAIKRKKTLHQQILLNSKEEISKLLHLEHSFILRWDLDTAESRTKYLKVLKCCAGVGWRRSV